MLDDYTQTRGGALVPAGLLLGGVFSGVVRRADGTEEPFEDRNLVVNEGLNRLLNATFNGASLPTTWYLGLFAGNYTPSATVTAANIASTATEATEYVQNSRPEFITETTSSREVTNSAERAEFTFEAVKTIYGAFLVSDPSKGGTSGVLMAVTRFSSSKSVGIDDEILLTYTLSAASS